METDAPTVGPEDRKLPQQCAGNSLWVTGELEMMASENEVLPTPGSPISKSLIGFMGNGKSLKTGGMR